MKVISTNFSSPRGRGTAGLFLGLFFLVALAPMGTTLTHVLAADSDIEGPKGLRGASMQAAGAAIGGEASHASEQNDGPGEHDGSEGGFLSLAESGTDSKGEAENAQRSGRTGDKASEKSSSPAMAAPAESGEPSEAPEATHADTRSEATGSETNRRSGDTAQQSVPLHEGKKEQEHLSSKESSPAAGAASNAGKTPAIASVDVPTTRNYSEDAGVKERVQAPSPAQASSSSTVMASSEPTALDRDSVDGVRVMGKVPAASHENEAEKERLSSILSPTSAVTAPPAPSDSAAGVQVKNVGDATGGGPTKREGSGEKAEGPLPELPAPGLPGEETQELGVRGEAARAEHDPFARNSKTNENPLVTKEEESKQQTGPLSSGEGPGAVVGSGGGSGPSLGHQDKADGPGSIGSDPAPAPGGLQKPNDGTDSSTPESGQTVPSGPQDGGGHAENLDPNKPQGESGNQGEPPQPQGGGGGSGSSGTGQGDAHGQNDPNSESQQGNETSTVSPSSSTAAPTTTTSSSTTYQKFWCAIISLLTVVPFLMAT